MSTTAQTSTAGMSDLFETPHADADAEVFSTARRRRHARRDGGASRSTWAARSAGTTRSSTRDRSRPSSSRTAPAPRSATPASGSSSRRSRATCWSTTTPPRRPSAGSASPGCRRGAHRRRQPRAHGPARRVRGRGRPSVRRPRRRVPARRRRQLGAARPRRPRPRRRRSTGPCSCTSSPRRSCPTLPGPARAPARPRPGGRRRQPARAGRPSGSPAAFRAATFEGFDVDEPSVTAARRHASAHGVDDRVDVLDRRRRHAARVPVRGRSTSSWPTSACTTCPTRSASSRPCGRWSRDDGYVLVMDERAAETFATPGRPGRAPAVRVLDPVLPAGRAVDPRRRRAPAR